MTPLRTTLLFTVRKQLGFRFLLAAYLVGASSALATDARFFGTNLIGPNGRLKLSYTTEAYRQEALRLVIEEANRVAKDLNLPEVLPITETNVVGGFISPFGFAYAHGGIGRVVTKKYDYGVSF